MADITMCDGKECPVKDKCRRFTSTPNQGRQSYFISTPLEIKDGKASCNMYWGENQDTIFNFLKDICK